MKNLYSVEMKQGCWVPYDPYYVTPMEALDSIAHGFKVHKGFGAVTEVRCVRVEDGKRKENQWELKIC